MRQILACCDLQRVAMDPYDALRRTVLPVETRLLLIPAERVPARRRLEELDFVGELDLELYPPRRARRTRRRCMTDGERGKSIRT